MILFPNAKINIGLNIVSRREDGYHNIETVMYPIGWSDVLEIVPARGNDATLTYAAAGGQLELNVMLPVMAEAFLDSVDLLADVLDSFRERCVAGIRPNAERMQKNLESSLMLVTALTPKIGYERAAEIARHAHATGMTLKEATLALGALTEEEFDEAVRPEDMV